MVCECSNNKRLSVEKMKNMPIDDIINLYQEGYRLEEIDRIEYTDPKMGDIIPKMEDIDSKIMTMTYGQQCSGNIDIAFNNTTQLLGTSGAVQKGTVWAQSFFSNFRCLDYVEFNVIKYANISFYIEIRRDDGTGKPKGIPLADDAGLIMRTPVIPYTELPTIWDWRMFTVGAILDATAGNYWICFVPVDFYDSPTYRELAYDRFGIQDGTNLSSYKSAVFKAGSWGTSSTFAFATYKKSTFATPTLTTIDISPATATVNIGATQVFSATPKDQWGNPITGVTITWNITDTTKGNIFPTTGSSVLFTATSSGSTIIKATSGTIVGSATVTITTPTPVLTTIAISPTTATIQAGATQQLTAICKDQNNTVMTCPTLTWTSSDPTKATVNSTGLVTGVSAGTTNITASAGGKTSNISAITITAPEQILTTIAISPTTQSINSGGIVQLTAICKDQNNTVMTCPTLTWTSSDPTKATVNSTGLVTGVSAGTTNITASAGGKTSNISAITVTGIISILMSITISPMSASIPIGGTRQLTVICKDQSDNVMTCPVLIWISSDPVKATISDTGLVTGMSVGNTSITASAAGKTSNSSAITVTTVPTPQAGGGTLIMTIAALAVAALIMTRKRKVSTTQIKE